MYNEYINVSMYILGIGVLEAKKPGVYFSVYRTSSFSSQNAIIPFQGTRLNIGNGMNATTGIFTAPIAGVYAFHFNGFKHKPYDNLISGQNGAVIIGFYVNDQHMGRAEAGLNTDFGTLSYSTVAQLRVRDQVKLMLTYGILHDSSVAHTRFSGALLHED